MQHLTCLHGFSYFASGLKSVGSRQCIGGRSWGFEKVVYVEPGGPVDFKKKTKPGVEGEAVM